MSFGAVSWKYLGGRLRGVLEVDLGSLGSQFEGLSGAYWRSVWSFWTAFGSVWHSLANVGAHSEIVKSCFLRKLHVTPRTSFHNFVSDSQILRLSGSQNLGLSDS